MARLPEDEAREGDRPLLEELLAGKGTAVERDVRSGPTVPASEGELTLELPRLDCGNPEDAASDPVVDFRDDRLPVPVNETPVPESVRETCETDCVMVVPPRVTVVADGIGV